MNLMKIPSKFPHLHKFAKVTSSRSLTVPAGTPGAGAGKGGGAGGSVRESGGGLGKFGAAQEEGYFYNKQKEQMKKIKQKLEDEKDTKKDEFYPNIPFKSNPSSLIKPKGETWSFQGVEASYVNHPRAFAEKGDKPEEPSKEDSGKEEIAKVKMPGFVHPETKNEEGYFTQKAKQQLEELKRRPDKPLLNPEKKDED